MISLSLAAAGASASAQQTTRVRCRDCPPSPEARAAQVRDSIRALGRGGFDTELQRLVEELTEMSQLQDALRQNLEAAARAQVDEANRKQVEVTFQRLKSRFDEVTRSRQALGSQLRALCDRTAKPQGYMGISFSATMRADTVGSGAEVFRFAENPTVESVEPGSPAERAGVQKGDEIVLIGGQPVAGREIVFTRLLRPGARLPMRLMRDGDARDVVLVIGRRPPALDSDCPYIDARIAMAIAEAPIPVTALPRGGPIVRAAPRRSAPAIVSIPGPPEPSEAPAAAIPSPRTTVVVTAPPTPLVPAVPAPAPVAPGRGAAFAYSFGSRNMMLLAGATLVAMDADLRESMGVKNGVFVASVARGTAAFSSGLKSGDVIVAIGRSPVSTPGAIGRAVQSSSDRELTLQIVRKQKRQSLVLRW